MALEKEQRRMGVSAEIGVTRGRGLAQARTAIGRTSQANTAAIQNFLNDNLLELERSEKEKGERLAKEVQLVYEDYTDKFGNTTQIAVNYETPEKLLSTSWSASAFDEEVVDQFMLGVDASITKIVNQETINAKQNMNVLDTTANVMNQFDVSLKEPLEILSANIPDELKTLYESRLVDHVERKRTEIANKHRTLKESLGNQIFTQKVNNYKDRQLTLSWVDPEQAQIEAQKFNAYAQREAVKGSNVAAAVFVQSTKKAIDVSLKLGKAISRYMPKNMSNPQELKIGGANLDKIIRVVRYGPGITESVQDIKTGEQITINHKTFGITKEEFGALDEDMSISIEKLRNLLASQLSSAQGSSDMLRAINRSSVSASNPHGINYLEDKQIITLGKEIDDLIDGKEATPHIEAMMNNYNANNEGANLTPFNFNTPEKTNEKIGFLSHIAANYQVMSDTYRDRIRATLNLGPDQSAAVISFLSSPEWTVLNSAPRTVSIKGLPLPQTNDLFGLLSEEQQAQAEHLRDSVKLFGPEEGARIYLEQQVTNKRDLNTLADVATKLDYDSPVELKEKIRGHLNDFTDSWFISSTPDAMISKRFSDKVVGHVERVLQRNPDANIGNQVNSILHKLVDRGEWGYSYTSISDGPVISDTTDDEAEYGDEALFVQFPPESTGINGEYTESQLQLIQDRIALTSDDQNRQWTDLKFGENVFLRMVGNPINIRQAVWQFVHIRSPRGIERSHLYTNERQNITISAEELFRAAMRDSDGE